MDFFSAPKYDVTVLNTTIGRYVVMFNGADWSLALRGPGFYHRLGTFPTKDEAISGRNAHYKRALEQQVTALEQTLTRLEEELNNEDPVDDAQ